MSNSLHTRGQYSRTCDSVYPEYPSTVCLLLGARHTGEQVADYYPVPEQVFPEQASDGYRASRTGEQDRQLRKSNPKYLWTASSLVCSPESRLEYFRPTRKRLLSAWAEFPTHEDAVLPQGEIASLENLHQIMRVQWNWEFCLGKVSTCPFLLFLFATKFLVQLTSIHLCSPLPSSLT